MNEIISFFSDIFCTNSTMKIGLSQFKEEIKPEIPIRKQKPVKSETKLSDLMRGA